jgi:hypothetical protein
MPAQIWAVFVLTLLHVVEIHLRALAYLMAIPGDQTDTFEVSPYGTSWHLMALPDRTKFSE